MCFQPCVLWRWQFLLRAFESSGRDSLLLFLCTRSLLKSTQIFRSESGPIAPNRPIRARDTKRVASEGCGHSIGARRSGLNLARHFSSSFRYVADSSHRIRIDFEGSFDVESCSCPRCPTRPRVSPTSVVIRFHIFGCVLRNEIFAHACLHTQTQSRNFFMIYGNTSSNFN